MAISGRKAVRKQKFFYIVAFRLTLRIRLFHIADDGLPTFIYMNLARRERIAARHGAGVEGLLLDRIGLH